MLENDGGRGWDQRGWGRRGGHQKEPVIMMLHIQVLSDPKNGSATVKLKLRKPKVMSKYGKIYGYQTLKIVVA